MNPINPKGSFKQRLECPACRKFYSPNQSPHLMNFTKGIVQFHCRSCHREIFKLTFKQWNALHQEQPKQAPLPPRRGREDKMRRRFPEKKTEPKQEPKKEPQKPSNRFYQSNLPN